MDFPTNEAAAYYLAAMIDGEGCVEFKPMPSAKSWRRRIRVTNTSPGIISAVEAACSKLGLGYTKHARSGTNRPAWEINIPGSSIPALAAVVALADEGKQARLAAAAKYRAEYTRDAATGRITGSVVRAEHPVT